MNGFEIARSVKVTEWPPKMFRVEIKNNEYETNIHKSISRSTSSSERQSEGEQGHESKSGK